MTLMTNLLFKVIISFLIELVKFSMKKNHQFLGERKMIRLNLYLLRPNLKLIHATII